jgi:hypothetical protein
MERMHVFQIKGLSGLIMLALALISGLLIIFALPSVFMLVLWNALIFEGLRGPEINLYQGFLLWGMMLICLKLIFQPEVHMQLMREQSDSSQSSATRKNSRKDQDKK